ncbi:MAG TPA: hypothetical protein VE986_01160 [Hyphomicrobiales bacterium]|nr:hypothetical protein [Hyphomicrobiales bacterium]
MTLGDVWGLLWPYLTNAGIAVVAVLAFLGLAPNIVGQRLLGHSLDRKLAELKHSQDAEIEALKAKLNRVSDRSTRSNEREYNAIIIAWESFVDAYISTLRCVYAFISHPDLSTMTGEQLADYLATTDFSEPQKKQMINSSDKNRMYSKIVEKRQIAEADSAIYEARSVLRKQAIFVPEGLEKKFEDALQILSAAQVHRQVSFDHGHFHDSEEPVGKLLKEGPKILAEIKTAVRERIFLID